MKNVLILLTLLLSVSSGFSRTYTALDVLYAKSFSELRGKRIGFICNQTSRTATRDFGPDILLKSKANIVAFFSPEHGFAGVRKAGVASDSTEMYNGVPVYSLYGDTRRPTKKMLAGITTLVFDIQDIGVRAYTYLSTMILAMEAAAENNIEFIVLDRPNPLGGERIEGGILDTSLKSFVGIIPIPYIHGMTLGELAQMAKGERWFKGAEKLKLKVIKMESWKRAMTWDRTGLKWTPPSPNIPTYESAVGCAMFGALGELGVISVGIGSDQPFLRIGSRLAKSERMKMILQSYLPSDVFLEIEDFTTPFGDTIKTYNGIRIDLPPITPSGEIFSAQFSFLADLIATDANIAKAYAATITSSKRMFDKVVGTSQLRGNIEAGNGSGLTQEWKKECNGFRTKRQKYLLYN
ncbi:MAG TPA: DUF1343 domain-containing protein [Candidatus Kapabacteria bacterium]